MEPSYVQVGDAKVRLYSLEEAADYCGGPTNAVHVQTVIRWRETGWLRSIKVGNSHIYTKELLDECLRLRGYGNRMYGEKPEQPSHSLSIQESPSSGSSLLDGLEKLAQLKEEGFLTDEEFANGKQKLLQGDP